MMGRGRLSRVSLRVYDAVQQVVLGLRPGALVRRIPDERLQRPRLAGCRGVPFERELRDADRVGAGEPGVERLARIRRCRRRRPPAGPPARGAPGRQGPIFELALMSVFPPVYSSTSRDGSRWVRQTGIIVPGVRWVHPDAGGVCPRPSPLGYTEGRRREYSRRTGRCEARS